MKKLVLFLFGLSFAFSFAQDRNVSYNVTASIGYPFVASKQKYEGNPTYKANIGFHVGALAGFKITTENELEVGLFYQQNEMKITSSPIAGVTNEIISDKYQIKMLYIPLNYKYNFEDGFFIKGGPLLSMDLENRKNPVRSVSGLGFGIAVGKDFELDNGLRLRINPYANAHTLWSFDDNNNFLNDVGIQLGFIF